jgi:hypothetical protein
MRPTPDAHSAREAYSGAASVSAAVPGFPVWDLGGFIGSTTWGLWVAALGVMLLLRPVRLPSAHVPAGSSRLPAPRPPGSADVMTALP